MKTPKLLISVALSMFTTLLVWPYDSSGDNIKILGITEGSIYTEFVNPRWYQNSLKAQLKKNDGRFEYLSNGQKIFEDGSYQLRFTDRNVSRDIRFVIDSKKSTAVIETNRSLNGAHIKIAYDSGNYYNDPSVKGTPMMAIWLEDASGNYLQSIYVSATPATNIMRYTDNWVARPQGLPVWMHKAGKKTLHNGQTIFLAKPANKIPEDIDAVSGATQKRSYVMKSRADEKKCMKPDVSIFLEINQSFDDGWYFNEKNNQHEEPISGNFRDDSFFKGTGVGEPSIVYRAKVDLRKHRTYQLNGESEDEIRLIGYGHFAGRTGIIYDDFYAMNKGKERFKFDHAHKIIKKLEIEVIPEK